MDERVIDVVRGKGNSFKGAKWIILAIVLLVIILALNPFVIVGAGERGVVLTFGAVQKAVFNEGLHLRIPLVQKIVKIDVRVQKSQVDSESVSKHHQDTHSIIAIN